jgi:Na+/H+-translocating membrane pyrophosphatase
VFYVNGP